MQHGCEAPVISVSECLRRVAQLASSLQLPLLDKEVSESISDKQVSIGVLSKLCLKPGYHELSSFYSVENVLTTLPLLPKATSLLFS